MKKQGTINELIITTKTDNEKIDGNVMVHTEIDMDVLASILSEKYNINKAIDNSEEYPETEFIMPRFDKCSCSIYFTDEHFSQILEQIQYIRQIAHTLPTFESREWIGSENELLDEYGNEGLDIDDGLVEQDMTDDFEETPLSRREKKLVELENEAEKLSKEEQQILESNRINDERI